MKRILLTGGAGYIGSHTCLELLKRNYNITVLDSFVNSSRDSLERVIKVLETKIPNVRKKIELKIGDIRDAVFLEKIFRNNQFSKNFDGVIHFCGLKSVNESNIKPAEYWDVNVLGTINLIKFMKTYNCDTLVFSSSATVYGDSNLIPISEDQIKKPINTYGKTKAVIEEILFDLSKAPDFNLKIAILRYFNPAGADGSGLLGEYPINKPNNIFPLLSRAALSKNKTFEIFGNDWPTIDGTCIRDYIHVTDLAEGHISSLEFLFKNKPQVACFNLGIGEGVSVLELVKIFQQVNQVKFPIKFSPRREGDVAITIAENRKAKNLLNWKPKKSIYDMCSDEFTWQKKFLQKNKN